MGQIALWPGVVHVSWRIGDFFFIYLFPFPFLLHNLFGAKGWEVFLNMEFMRRCICLFFISLSGLEGIANWDNHLGGKPSGVGRSCTICYNVLLFYSLFIYRLYYHHCRTLA